MIKQITSLQNPLIKQLFLLQEKSRERRKSGLFLIEGKREIVLAVKGGYEIETLVFCKEIISENEVLKLVSAGVELIEITLPIYQKLAYRDTTEGVLAIVKSKEHSLENVLFKTENPLVLVAEAPEKPGNIGALLRTADAANVAAVLIANPKIDLYNPNSVRSSVGGLFTSQIAVGTTQEIITFLKEKNISIYAAALQASKPYTEIDFTTPSAIVVGTEADGLSDEWLNNATQNIIIPMEGEIDSMNVSVAAAILIFEAKRQRGGDRLRG